MIKKYGAFLLRIFGWSLLLISGVQADEPVHIQQAQIQETEGYGYAAPARWVNVKAMDEGWETVALPHALTRKFIPEAPGSDFAGPPTVETWYRLDVPEPLESSNPRYLYIPRWKTDGQIAVYSNGQLLYQSHTHLFWNGWNTPLWIALDDNADATQPRAILIRIERPRNMGGGISSVWIGENDRLGWRYHLRYLLQIQVPYMSSVAFLIVGIYSLVVWCRRRGETLYLLFFFISLASFLRTLHYHVGENPLLISDEWFSWLTVNSLFWLISGVHFFLNYLHLNPLRRMDQLVIALTVGLSILSLPVFPALPNFYLVSPVAYVFLMFMGTAVGVAGIVQSRKADSKDGVLLSSWCLLGMVLWLYDWLLQSNYIDIESIYLGPYTNIVAFLLFLSIMFRRYVNALDEVKVLNTSLALRLKAREEELLQSYQVQRDISHQQTLTEERQRMMQDMHDGMGSSLRTALLTIEKGHLDTAMVTDVLKGCIDDLKLAIDAMEPVQTDLLLLLATLRYRLGPRLEGAGIVLRWEIQNVPALDWLNHRNALHILRIVQEAFTNIIKHTQSTEIRVATGTERPWVFVTIEDNGQGFDVAQSMDRSGKGLRNQMRRAESIGAEIDWQSSQAGTRLTLRLPIERPWATDP
jgi:signal transduction histidine kinase